MNPECLKCKRVPVLFEELFNVYKDGNAIRMMEIMMSLTELGTKTGLLTNQDRTEITLFNHILSLIAQYQVHLLKTKIENNSAPQ
ncbi:hypothetical protein ACRQ5D_10955 [Mucilaginibacter sp. P25]|uniref:hypothetical protein n=1 Tax=Mucilaginibacter sp. P25 TaxID=3423945 RepID=UPI003D795362